MICSTLLCVGCQPVTRRIFGSGDEDGRVAGAARCFFDFEVFAGDFLSGFDHFTDAEAVLSLS